MTREEAIEAVRVAFWRWRRAKHALDLARGPRQRATSMALYRRTEAAYCRSAKISDEIVSREPAEKRG